MPKQLLAAIALLAFAPLLPAQNGACQRVGVLDLKAALVGTTDGKKASAELDTKFDGRQKQLEAQRSELVRLQTELETTGKLLSPDRQSQLTSDIEAKKKRFDRDTQDLQEAFSAEQQRVLETLSSRLELFMRKYAADKNLSVILDASIPNTAILVAADSVNVTQDVIAQYDKTSK